jgi:hypothetical protein
MIRFFYIVLLSCIFTLLVGCSRPAETIPIWEKVKLRDLSPKRYGGTKGRELKTTNFDIFIFDIPAENINLLDDACQRLYTRPLRYNDYKAFGANSFLACFGQSTMWDNIALLLRNADAREIDHISLLLTDGQTDDLAIAFLDREQTIFYVSNSGLMEGATIGPGKLVLRIKAEKIPGSRGVSNVSFMPAFPSPTKSLIPQIAAYEKSGEFLFKPVGFRLKMNPDDFIFLGPKEYSSDLMTLGSLFFSRPQPKPSIRALLIICSRINY